MWKVEIGVNHDGGECKVLGEYKLLRELGEANMSRYVLAVHELHRSVHMIRVMSKSLLNQSDEVRDLFYNELAALRRHSHPSVVPLTEILEDERCAYVVTTYLSGPPFCDMLSTAAAPHRSRNSESRARTLYHQVVNIALFLERHKIAHWFKLQNIIQASRDKLILLDFRSAEEEGMNRGRTVLSLQSTHYRAPELLYTESYDAAGNAWACGVALYMLITGTLPFDTKTTERDLKEKILFSSFNLPTWVSAGARDLICVLLRKQPATRLALRDISKHPWFADGILGHDDKSVLLDTMWSRLSLQTPRGKSRAEGSRNPRHGWSRTTSNRTRTTPMELISPPQFSLSHSQSTRLRPKSVTFEQPLPSALLSKRLAPRVNSTPASLRAKADEEHMRIAQQLVEEEAGMNALESIPSFTARQNRRRSRDSVSLPDRKRTKRQRSRLESQSLPHKAKRWSLEFRSPVIIRRLP